MLKSAHQRNLLRICCAEIEVDGLGSYPHIPGGRPHGSDSRCRPAFGREPCDRGAATYRPRAGIENPVGRTAYDGLRPDKAQAKPSLPQRSGLNRNSFRSALTLADRRRRSQALFASALPMDWGTTFLPASLARLPRVIPTYSFNWFPCREHSRYRGGRPTLRSRWTARSRAGSLSKSSPTTRSASMAQKVI